MKKFAIAIKSKTALIVAIIFLFSNVAAAADGAAAATAEDYEMAMVIMRDLGVMSAYEDGSLRPTQTVSRAEFADMTVKLLGLDKISLDNSFDSFSDVKSDYWAYDSIAVAYSLNIISTSEDGLFHPDDGVTLQQAVKMLVCALGYRAEAEANGGWPYGYGLTAGRLRLTNNSDIDGAYPLDRKNTALLLYRVLNTNIMKTSSIGRTTEGNTLFNEMSDIRNWKKDSGILIADYDTDLTGEQKLERDEVVINNEIYKIGSTDASKYLGNYVTFYGIEEEEGGEKRILAVYADKKRNSVLDIDASMIDNISIGSLSYRTDENTSRNAEKITFSGNLKLVVNGQRINGFTQNDLNISEGNVRVIDNDGDGLYDILFLMRSASFVTDRVNQNGDIIFLKNGKLNGRKSILADTGDKTQHITVIKNGKEISVSEINADDVITVYASPNGKRMRIEVSDKTVEGVLDEYFSDDREVTIDEKVYKVSESYSDASADLKAGTFMRFYIDVNGKVVYARDADEAEGRVGYLLECALVGGLDSSIVLKVLFGGKTYEVEDKNDKDKTITEVKNSDISVLKTARCLKIDNKNMTADEALSYLSNVKVFTFEKNDAGEVTSIKSCEMFAQEDKRKFNKDIKSFGGTTKQAFQIDDSTNVILYSGGSDDDYFVNVKIKDGSEYNVEGYTRRDDNKFVVDTMVLYDPTMASVVGMIDEDTSASIVKSVSRTIGEDGGEYYLLDCYTDGKEEKKEVKSTYRTEPVIGTLKAGSVIKYTDDSYGRIDNISVVCQLASQARNIHTDEHGLNEKITARCMSVETEQLSNTLNEIVDIIKLSITGSEDDEKTFNVPLGDDVSYYTFRKNNTVEPANAEYLRTAETVWADGADYVFIHSVYDKVKIVVIFE